jgi:hypothetical protein
VTIPTWAKYAAAVVAIVLLVLAGRAWLAQHDARLGADAAKSTAAPIIADAQKQIDAAKADAAKAVADRDARLAQIERQRKQPVTPQSFVAELPKVITSLPEPATIVPAPATSKEPAGSAAAVAVQIPAADLQALQNYKLDCDATGVKLDACQKIANAQLAELAASHTQLMAVIKERDADETALKGGTFWRRMLKSVECIAASGGGAAVGAWADKSQRARGAAVGAVTGTIVCEAF